MKFIRPKECLPIGRASKDPTWADVRREEKHDWGRWEEIFIPVHLPPRARTRSSVVESNGNANEINRSKMNENHEIVTPTPKQQHVEECRAGQKDR